MPTLEQYAQSINKEYVTKALEDIKAKKKGKAAPERKVMPVRSHPVIKDTDHDGILDLTEYKYPDVLNPNKRDTIESLYDKQILLGEMQAYIGSAVPFYAIKLEDNNITINMKVKYFFSEIEDNQQQYYINMFESGIKERWENTFYGTQYDFYEGMKIKVNINFLDNTNIITRYATIKIKNENGRSHTFPIRLGWSPYQIETITLYTKNDSSFLDDETTFKRLNKEPCKCQ